MVPDEVFFANAVPERVSVSAIVTDERINWDGFSEFAVASASKPWKSSVLVQFVGVEATMALAVNVVGRRGLVVLVGLGGYILYAAGSLALLAHWI